MHNDDEWGNLGDFDATDTSLIKRLTSRSKKTLEKRTQTKIAKGLIRDNSVYYKIYEESWTKDRGSKLYKQLSKKYNVPYGTVYTVANGTMLNIGKATSVIENHAERLDAWNREFGNKQWTWKVISPDGIEYTFERQTDAGEWACNYINKPRINKHTYGGYASYLYRQSKTKRNGIWKGWVFQKINNSTGILEN